MLESMLGPDTMKKMMGTGISLAVAVMAFVGTALIVVSAVNPIWHAHFWAGIAMIAFGGMTLAVRGKVIRLVFSILVLAAGLWVLLNVIGGWVVPKAVEFGDLLSGDAGLPEMIAPILLMIAGLGGLIGAFGGLVGIFGALKY
jgi:hypothetical protein